MKKLFSVLAVLLVATALFAQVGLTVKAGGAFGFANYKSVATASDKAGEEHKWEEGLNDKALILKEKGIGFDVAVQYDITDNLLAYVDFNMLFPKDAKINYPNEIDVMVDATPDVIKKYMTDGKFNVYSLEGLIADLNKYCPEFKDHAKTSTKYSFFSVSAGAAYKLDFNAVKLNVGGGVTLNKGTAKFNMEFDEYFGPLKTETVLSFTSFGLNALVEAKYMVADNIGVGVTLMPQVGLYSNGSIVMKTTIEDNTETETITSKGFAINFAMPIVVGVSYTF